MMTNFLDLFHLYLIPFAIAVPIAILAIYISTRNVADRQTDAKEIEERALEKLRLEEIRESQFKEEARQAEAIQREAQRAAEAQREARRVEEAEREARLVAELQQAERRITELKDAERRIEELAAEAQRKAQLAAQAPPLDLSLAEPGAEVRLLLVDDSAVARAKLRKLFESNGFLVETAGDGVEALETIQKHRFSVIVTDLEMPNMDGFELIAAVQGSMETEDIPMLAITGHEELQARVHDMKGLYGIFKKPWNDRELLKRVQALSMMRARKPA